MSMRQIRNESANSGSQAVNGGCGRDVQSSVVLVAPGEICRLLRHDDCAEVASRGVPHPDSSGPGDKNISLFIQLHAVGHTVAFASGLRSENSSIGQRCVRSEIVNTNISLLAIVHIEFLAIRRKAETVRLG